MSQFGANAAWMYMPGGLSVPWLRFGIYIISGYQVWSWSPRQHIKVWKGLDKNVVGERGERSPTRCRRNEELFPTFLVYLIVHYSAVQVVAGTASKARVRTGRGGRGSL